MPRLCEPYLIAALYSMQPQPRVLLGQGQHRGDKQKAEKFLAKTAR